MNGSLINIGDFIKIGIMALVFIFLVNWILRRLGINFQA
jgi:hypothetical protein